MRARVTKSGGNVFEDLGFASEEAEHLIVRSNLMIQLLRVMKARKLTQVRAAKLFGVTQPRVSDLVRGKIELFSIDGLIEMLSRAGIRVRLVVTSRRRNAKIA